MGVFYSIELVLLAAKLWRELRQQHGRLDTWQARGTLAAAQAACTTLGSVFGTVIGRTGFSGMDSAIMTILLALGA